MKLHGRPYERAIIAMIATVAVAAAVLVAPATPAGAQARATASSDAEPASKTPIMQPPILPATWLASWFESTGISHNLPISIDELARYFIEEGRAEGVRGDIAFAQSVLETGYFRFPSYGQVRPSHNNYAGIGAVDGGSSPNRFSSPRIGVRAQMHHLRAYADPTVTADNLAYPLESPRFHLVSPKGRAPHWEDLGGGDWATDPDYARKIASIWRQIVNHGPVPEFLDVTGVHVDAVDRIAAAGVTTGCRPGYFCPTRPVTRAEIAAFLVRAHPELSYAAGSRFDDVEATHPHAGAIAALADANLASGCGEGDFCPDAPVTRAQLASMLQHALGVAIQSAPHFRDVGADHPHFGAVNGLAAVGIARGCGAETYCPNASTSRAQMASLLVRAFGL